MSVNTFPRLTRCTAVALLGCATLMLAACGSSKKSSSASASQTLSLSIKESGKSAVFTAPKSATGGLVTISLTNKGSGPHGAQFVQVTGGHTIQQAFQALGAAMQSNKTPSWLRAEGGPPGAYPGSTTSVTQVLPAGQYLIADLDSNSNGPPAYTQMTVSGGSSSGSLPSTPSTVTAATAGKDKYKWDLSGAAFKTGQNRITFNSKGNNTLHQITYVRITGNPSKQQIIKALNFNGPGPPPSFVDPNTFGGTGAIDSGKSLVTTLTFPKPGKYVLFCPLHDRDGGKAHYAEGLLRTVTVQ